MIGQTISHYRILEKLGGSGMGVVYEGFASTRVYFSKKPQDRPEAVAAKFLNTYLYQLMKYEPCRPLWKHLDLPLDSIILHALFTLNRQMKSPALSCVGDILKKSAYSLTHPEYMRVQDALLDFLDELNSRPGTEVKLKSRIELNLLWAAEEPLAVEPT